MMISGIVAFEGEDNALDDGRWLSPGNVTWECPLPAFFREEEGDFPGTRKVGTVVSIVRMGHALMADIELDEEIAAELFGHLDLDGVTVVDHADDSAEQPVGDLIASGSEYPAGINWEMSGEIKAVTMTTVDTSNHGAPLVPVIVSGGAEHRTEVEFDPETHERPLTPEEIQANEDKMAEALMAAMSADVGDRQWRDANNYQRQCLTTAALDATETWYFALGLANEAGEAAGKIKKLYRDDGGVMSDERREMMKGELGDVAWYLAVLCASCRLDFGDVLAANVNKLKGRVERGTLHGDGDSR